MTAILLALAPPIGIGVALLACLGLARKAHPALVSGAAFGVGMGLIGLVLAILPLAGVPLRMKTGVPAVVLVGVAMSALMLSAGRRRGASDGAFPAWAFPAEGEGKRRRLRWTLRAVWWLGFLALGVRIALATWRAMGKPMMGWDAFIVHSFRAKVLYYDQTWSSESLRWIGNADYPLGMPLAELWVTWFQGQWDDTAFKVLFPCVLVALLAMVYGGLREVFGPLGAMGGTWLVAALPLLVQHATDAYLDVPLAYATFGASVFLWRYARTRARSDLLVASWMAAFGVWIKNEGALAFGIEVALLAVWFVRDGRLRDRAAWRDLGWFAAPPFLVWGGWALFKAASGISSPLTVQVSEFVDHADRLPAVLAFVARELWQSANWHALWPLFFGGWLLHVRRSLDPAFLFFGWPVVLTLAALIAVSAGTVMYQYLLQGTTLHRVVLHVAPLAAFWVAVMLGEAIKKPVEETSTG